MKTSFIITLLCTLTLVGCGSNNVNTSNLLSTKTFYEECEIDRQQLRNIEDNLDEQSLNIQEQLNEIMAKQDSLAEALKETSAPETPVTQSPTPETPVASIASTGTPIVSVLYNNELLAVPVSADSKFSPFELTYPGHADRDLTIMIYGSISHINLVDEKGSYISTLSFLSTKNGMNYLYFYMDNDGVNGAKFYFEIVTTGNQSYYFGVDYHK